MLLFWMNGSKWSIYDIYPFRNVIRKSCVHNHLGIITIFDVMTSGRRGRQAFTNRASDTSTSSESHSFALSEEVRTGDLPTSASKPR